MNDEKERGIVILGKPDIGISGLLAAHLSEIKMPVVLVDSFPSGIKDIPDVHIEPEVAIGFGAGLTQKDVEFIARLGDLRDEVLNQPVSAHNCFARLLEQGNDPKAYLFEKTDHRPEHGWYRQFDKNDKRKNYRK